jgi:succinate-acetate transporter protein
LSVPYVGPSAHPRHISFWIRELPFSLLLLLTLGGVAYTSFSKHPMLVYWEILAPIIGLGCVWYGWPTTSDNSARLRLIGTQVLHWLAFLLVMNMVFLSSVQRLFTANSTGLAIFTLLALGTFTAGVHILSWQVGLLGLIMAFGIPAIAWIENSSLLLILVAAVVIGIAVAVWWHFRERARAA